MISRGFTLIELLVTLAVAVILATTAVPGFMGMMARNQQASDYNEVLTGLNLARSEAIKRREDVSLVVVKSDPPWRYQVLLEVDDTILRERNAGNDRVSVLVDDDFKVVFNALGRVAGGDCDGGCSLEVKRDDQCGVISVSSLGRVGREGCVEEAEGG